MTTWRLFMPKYCLRTLTCQMRQTRLKSRAKSSAVCQFVIDSSSLSLALIKSLRFNVRKEAGEIHTRVETLFHKVVNLQSTFSPQLLKATMIWKSLSWEKEPLRRVKCSLSTNRQAIKYWCRARVRMDSLLSAAKNSCHWTINWSKRQHPSLCTLKSLCLAYLESQQVSRLSGRIKTLPPALWRTMI